MGTSLSGTYHVRLTWSICLLEGLGGLAGVFSGVACAVDVSAGFVATEIFRLRSFVFVSLSFVFVSVRPCSLSDLGLFVLLWLTKVLHNWIS